MNFDSDFANSIVIILPRVNNFEPMLAYYINIIVLCFRKIESFKNYRPKMNFF